MTAVLHGRLNLQRVLDELAAMPRVALAA